MQIPIETNHEIKANIFTKVKISYQQLLVFLHFMNAFSEAAVRRCSSKYVLLKILQCSELRRDSNTGIFL